MKNYKIFSIFLILFLIWILFYRFSTNIFDKNNIFEENSDSSIFFRWILLNNYEILDISDIYENNDWDFDLLNNTKNFTNNKTFINWFGQIIYSIEPSPPVDLWDGNILKFEKIDEKNNLKYSHLQNSITNEEIYSIIAIWPQK